MTEAERRKRRGRRYLSWLGSLVLVTIVALNVDVSEAVRLARSAQPQWIVLAVAFLLAERLVITSRWPMLVRLKGHSITLWEAFRIDWMSLFVGLALPSMLTADGVRGYKLFRSIADLRTSVSSILLDRVIGLLALVTTATVSLVLGVRTFGVGPATVAAAVTVAAFLVTWVFLFRSWHVDWLKGRFSRLGGSRWWGRLTALHSDFEAYGASPTVLLKIFVLALAAMAFRIGVMYAMASSIGVDLPLFYYLVFVPVVFLAMMLPVSVGGIGAREASLTVMFSMAGEPPETGATVGAMISMMAVLFSLPGGLFLLLEGRTGRSESPDPTGGTA